jgi:hypothetical protein
LPSLIKNVIEVNLDYVGKEGRGCLFKIESSWRRRRVLIVILEASSPPSSPTRWLI